MYAEAWQKIIIPEVSLTNKQKYVNVYLPVPAIIQASSSLQ